MVLVVMATILTMPSKGELLVAPTLKQDKNNHSPDGVSGRHNVAGDGSGLWATWHVAT
jgi:hypothetical protein